MVNQMKVNITGRGIIPGLGTIPPIYGKDLSEVEINRILNFPNLRVYAASSGVIITKNNVKNFFHLSVEDIIKKAEKLGISTQVEETIPPVENEQVQVTTSNPNKIDYSAYKGEYDHPSEDSSVEELNEILEVEGSINEETSNGAAEEGTSEDDETEPEVEDGLVEETSTETDQNRYNNNNNQNRYNGKKKNNKKH